MNKNDEIRKLLEKLEIEQLEHTQKNDTTKKDDFEFIDLEEPKDSKFKIESSDVEKIEDQVNQKLAHRKEKIKLLLIRPRTVLVIFFIMLLSFYVSGMSKVNEIVVDGNIKLSNQDVLRLGGIKKNDNLITTSSYKIENNLKTNNNIESVNVSKNILNQKIYIKIKEVEPLFYYKKNNENIVVLKNGLEKSFKQENVNYAKLIVNNSSLNQIPNLVSVLSKLKPEVLNEISEIDYKPTSVFKNRYLLKLNDGNFIYAIDTKLAKKMNYYQELKRTLPQKTLNIYFENADYFKER